MLQKLILLLLVAAFCFPVIAVAQHSEHHATSNISGIEPQPLLAQAIRLKEALSFLGSSLSMEDEKRLLALEKRPLTQQVVKDIQDILDPYCLAMININPEARVKLERGPAKANLIQGGWKSFLVKVINDAGVTAQLEVESPNAAAPLFPSTFNHHVMQKNILTAGDVVNRFLEVIETGICCSSDLL
jgi:hypothetical protein